MSTYQEENRKRLINLIGNIPKKPSPDGWSVVSSLAVGGLTAIGFSKSQPLLLVISSQGRSVINCETGEKVARDYEEYAGLDEFSLICSGFGPLESEIIYIAGIYGGGLPLLNKSGEGLEVVSPSWPENELIFSQSGKAALVEGHQSHCANIFRDHIRAYGFSWCGNYIVVATGSDLKLWKRNERL